MNRTMLFNPFTGKPRDPRDIASDPAGILMLDPDEPVRAAFSPPSVGPVPVGAIPDLLTAAKAAQTALRALTFKDDKIVHALERLYVVIAKATGSAA